MESNKNDTIELKKQKQTQRFQNQTYAQQRRNMGERRDKLWGWDLYLHPAIYSIDR